LERFNFGCAGDGIAFAITQPVARLPLAVLAEPKHLVMRSLFHQATSMSCLMYCSIAAIGTRRVRPIFTLLIFWLLTSSQACVRPMLSMAAIASTVTKTSCVFTLTSLIRVLADYLLADTFLITCHVI